MIRQKLCDEIDAPLWNIAGCAKKVDQQRKGIRGVFLIA